MTESDRRRANVAIAILIAAGIALRLFVVRAQGFPSDVGTFMAWAERLAATNWREIHVYFMHEPTAPPYALSLQKYASG